MHQNTRLRAIIEQLTTTLEAERAASSTEDSELIALLSSKLSARSQRRAEALEDTRATVVRAVEEVTRSQEGHAQRRGDLLSVMGERNEWLGGAMKERLGEVKQRGEEGKVVSCASLCHERLLTVLSLTGARWIARGSSRRDRSLPVRCSHHGRGADRGRPTERYCSRVGRSSM